MEPCLLIYCWIRKSILNNTLIPTGENSPLCNDLFVFLHEFLGMLCSGKLGVLTNEESETWTWGTRPEKKEGIAHGRRASSREEAQWSHTPSDPRNSIPGHHPWSL